MIQILDSKTAQASLLSRGAWDDAPLSAAQIETSKRLFGEVLSIDAAVKKILSEVRREGDEALFRWTSLLDGLDYRTSKAKVRVSTAELAAAAARIDPALLEAFKISAERVYAFHKKQPAISWIDTAGKGLLGQKVCPIGRVACYIPAGSAPLASTVLMTVMIAKAAGVPEIVVVSPPDRKTGKVADITLAAAHVCGVQELYAVGGAQAIGALAFGTNSIPRVDKIVGPGNSFVMEAKRQVYGVVGIDALPGPTETIVVADDTANPAWVAADLMAQSEHAGGTSLLLSPSRAFVDKVDAELERQCPGLASADMVRESFAKRSGAVICSSLAEAVQLADTWAPEHLCLSVADPWSWLGNINRAGGVFIGEHSYEVLGDYVAGPSHTMPTGGTARFASPCNVLDFVRVMNLIALDPASAENLGPIAARLADSEGLAAHANAARIRTKPVVN